MYSYLFFLQLKNALINCALKKLVDENGDKEEISTLNAVLCCKKFTSTTAAGILHRLFRIEYQAINEFLSHFSPSVHNEKLLQKFNKNGCIDFPVDIETDFSKFNQTTFDDIIQITGFKEINNFHLPSEEQRTKTVADLRIEDYLGKYRLLCLKNPEDKTEDEILLLTIIHIYKEGNEYKFYDLRNNDAQGIVEYISDNLVFHYREYNTNKELIDFSTKFIKLNQYLSKQSYFLGMEQSLNFDAVPTQRKFFIQKLHSNEKDLQDVRTFKIDELPKIITEFSNNKDFLNGVYYLLYSHFFEKNIKTTQGFIHNLPQTNQKKQVYIKQQSIEQNILEIIEIKKKENNSIQEILLEDAHAGYYLGWYPFLDKNNKFHIGEIKFHLKKNGNGNINYLRYSGTITAGLAIQACYANQNLKDKLLIKSDISFTNNFGFRGLYILDLHSEVIDNVSYYQIFCLNENLNANVFLSSFVTIKTTEEAYNSHILRDYNSEESYQFLLNNNYFHTVFFQHLNTNIVESNQYIINQNPDLKVIGRNKKTSSPLIGTFLIFYKLPELRLGVLLLDINNHGQVNFRYLRKEGENESIVKGFIHRSNPLHEEFLQIQYDTDYNEGIGRGNYLIKNTLNTQIFSECYFCSYSKSNLIDFSKNAMAMSEHFPLVDKPMILSGEPLEEFIEKHPSISQFFNTDSKNSNQNPVKNHLKKNISGVYLSLSLPLPYEKHPITICPVQINKDATVIMKGKDNIYFGDILLLKDQFLVKISKWNPQEGNFFNFNGFTLYDLEKKFNFDQSQYKGKFLFESFGVEPNIGREFLIKLNDSVDFEKLTHVAVVYKEHDSLKTILKQVNLLKLVDKNHHEILDTLFF